MTGKTLTRGVLLAAIVVLAAASGTVMGAWNGQVMVSDDTAGAEDVTYTFIATVGDELDGAQLHNDSIEINLQYAGFQTEEWGSEDVELVAIDTNGDFPGAQFNVVLTPAVESVTSTNTGRSVAIRLNTSVDDTRTNPGLAPSDTSVSENDEVIVQISNITNPAAGEYPVKIDLSAKTTGGEATAVLDIQPEQTTTMSTTMNQTSTQTTSGDGGPGFTVALAGLAFLAAALIALRRT